MVYVVKLILCIIASLTSSAYCYKYVTKEFTVPVDHFNFLDNRTFSMRYLYNDSFVDKTSKNSAVLFYTGNEGNIELFAKNTGFMWELAKELSAYVVFAEHRYYGKSLPFGNSSYNVSSNNLAYFTVEQTLEDFVLLIEHMRTEQTHQQLAVIAFGGSYGGMLSAWLRIKYPHIVNGALAASAPIWQFTGLTDCELFNKIVTSVYTTAYNSNCSENIRHSWKAFETLAANDEGKKQLSEMYKLCTPIKTADDFTKFLVYLEDLYSNVAMANYPYENSFLAPLPANPVRQLCFYLKDLHVNASNTKQGDNNLLHAIQSAISVYTNYTGTTKCLDYKYEDGSDGVDVNGWNIQTCNQMVMPMCSKNNETMFRDQEYNFKEISDECEKQFHMRPKPFDIIMRYGGKNLQTVSNIIFSNGLLDPWCGGGVLQTPNDDIQIVIIPEGAHHIDLRESNAADPGSVRDARKKETKIIKKWIAQYYEQMKHN